jgi:hypothetical protein
MAGIFPRQMNRLMLEGESIVYSEISDISVEDMESLESLAKIMAFCNWHNANGAQRELMKSFYELMVTSRMREGYFESYRTRLFEDMGYTEEITRNFTDNLSQLRAQYASIAVH